MDNKKILEDLVKQKVLYCLKDGMYLSSEDLHKNKCYLSLGDYSHCEYLSLVLFDGDKNEKS